MSKKMLIYWYTTKKDFNSIESYKTYCIGEVDPMANKYFGMTNEDAVKTRIKEELSKVKDGAGIHISDIADLGFRMVDFPNPKEKLKGMDKDVHAVLRDIGCKQSATEWFNTSAEEIKRVLNHIETGEPLGTKYTLRKRQAEVIEKLNKNIDKTKHAKQFGLFAMPRFGKTIVSFEMLNQLFAKHPDKKYAFFISAKLDAEQAVREDYYKFDQSCNFKLCLYNSDIQPTKEDLANNKWLFFASKQWFDGKTLEQIQEKFPIVNRDDCVAVFFDEAHFARMTPNAQKTIELLNPTIQIDITGTPFRLKSQEDYNDDNSYVYSVLDEAVDYENAIDKSQFRLSNPELVYITPENEFFRTDSTFSEFFDSDKAKEEIKRWVMATFWGGKLHIGKETLDVQNAIVVLPPRIKYCELFADAVNELAREKHLAIKCVKASAKKDTTDESYISDNAKRFQEWNRECKADKSTIHLLATFNKGLQSVSFPDCHAVIMISDMVSPEAYIQAAFRSKTPNDVKRVAYVIDYNKGRTLHMIDTFIKNHLFVQACDSNYKNEYNRALSTIQIRDHNLIRQNYTFEEIFTTFTQTWNIERITDEIDFDIDKLLSRIDLSKVKIADLQKPHQLTLELTERGDKYDPVADEDPQLTEPDDPLTPETPSIDSQVITKQIEKLKDELVKYGYIPLGGTEKDRIKDIKREDIKRRTLPVCKDDEECEVWSYLGAPGEYDDIYIDESVLIPSALRWKYVKNNKFVIISGQESHGDGEHDKKKAKALINAIVRYLPAYFLCSGQPDNFDDFAARFGRYNTVEKYPERQYFRMFIGANIDFRYALEILKACDAVSREQIIAFCKSKVDKCYDKNGILIPEQVLKLLFNYAKDGSRPVPRELADKMRNGKNFDIAVCGGYWLTDETTKMYISDSFSDAEIMKKLRPNCEVIYSIEILATLEKHQEKIMKFKSFIQNPPYGGLHLPILKRMVELIVDNGGHGVSLQPVRWLQDPLKEYKQGTDYKKYKDVFSGRINNIETLVSMECSKIFDALFAMDLGIFELKQNEKFLLDSCYKDELLEKILKKITDTSLSHTVINNVMEKNKRLGIRVKVNDIQGNGIGEKGPSKNRIGKYKTFVSIDGFIDGKDWTECVQKNQFSKEFGSQIPFSIEFENMTNALNFANSTETIFFQYLLIKMHRDIHVPNQWLPFMNDYSEPWTDERFYAYFDITPDEQKIIEKTVADAKK